MGSEYLITLLLFVLLFLVFTCYIKPYRTMKAYQKNIKNLGYTTMLVPFNPFKIDLFECIGKGLKSGDAMRVYKQERNKYDVIISNSLSATRLELYHPDFIKEFYAVDKHYQYPKVQRIIKALSRIGGNGLPLSQGSIWARKRKILNKVFNFDFVKSQTQKIAENCSHALKQFEERSNKNQDGVVEYNICGLVSKMFSSVIFDSFLGGTSNEVIDNQPAGEYVKNLMQTLNNQARQPINAFLGPDFYKLGITKNQRQVEKKLKAFQQWCINFIRKRIKEINKNLDESKQLKNPKDIIQALLIAQRSSSDNTEQSMASQKEIFQQFCAFLIAGTDTTSNFTQSMIYAIALNPEIEKKVRQQIEQYMQKQDYSYENLKNFKYIDMVQKQTTRYYGPGTHTFTRMAKVDNYLNGLAIRKNTEIAIMNIGNHFNVKYFKNANQFRPERWQNECDDLPNYVFGGFSAGARTCIGKHLALIQNKIALIKFFKRYTKIVLGNPNFKMIFKFLYSPEDFESKMTINKDYKL